MLLQLLLAGKPLDCDSAAVAAAITVADAFRMGGITSCFCDRKTLIYATALHCGRADGMMIRGRLRCGVTTNHSPRFQVRICNAPLSHPRNNRWPENSHEGKLAGCISNHSIQ